MPGAIRTVSIPAATNTGHRMSASWHAANNSASESLGAARFAANPSAKCPTNMEPLRGPFAFFVQVVQPLLHERFVEPSGLHVSSGVVVGQAGVLGTIV